MLVLDRTLKEEIKITVEGPQTEEGTPTFKIITIKVLTIGRGKVKLGFDAAPDVRIERDDMRKVKKTS